MMKKFMQSLMLIILLISVIIYSSSGIKASQGSDQVIIDHLEEVRIDQKFEVEILNLNSDKSYELIIRAEDHQGEEWINQKEFIPETEDYLIAEDKMMELIQYMEPEPEITDMYYPPIDDLKDSWDTEILLKKNNQLVNESTINRTYSIADIDTREINDGSLIGELFKAPDSETAPGVVVLHGSEGRKSRLRALMLAEHGFNALAIQYFGPHNELPDQLVEVPIEIVKDAGNWLIENNYSDGNQVGLYGVSKGGELALLAGSKFDIFRNVVAMVPSGVIMEGSSGSAISPGSSWSYQDEPLDYIPNIRDYEVYSNAYEHGFASYFTKSLEEADSQTVEAATIQIEKIDGSILMVSGADDRMWDSETLLQPAEKRLEEYDYHDSFRHLIFEEAGHTIITPYMPTANRDKVERYIYGSNQKGSARADAEHWPEVLNTLRGE